MTTKLNKIKHDKDNLLSIEKKYKLYVIFAYRRWRKFNPYKPGILLECYFYLLAAKFILFIITTRISILRTIGLMMQPKNIVSLIFLITFITCMTTIVKLIVRV